MDPKSSHGEKLLFGMREEPPQPQPCQQHHKGSGEEEGSEPRVLSQPILAFLGRQLGSNKQAGNVSAKLSAGPGSTGQGREEMGIYSRSQGEQPPAANVLWVQIMGHSGISFCPNSMFIPCLGPERRN